MNDLLPSTSNLIHSFASYSIAATPLPKTFQLKKLRTVSLPNSLSNDIAVMHVGVFFAEKRIIYFNKEEKRGVREPDKRHLPKTWNFHLQEPLISKPELTNSYQPHSHMHKVEYLYLFIFFIILT